jgi:hypothetical protein
MTREARRTILLAMADFYRCPTTGRVVEGIKDDDKLVCGCGKSNPRAQEDAQRGIVHHIKRLMQTATVDEYIAQEEARRSLHSV